MKFILAATALLSSAAAFSPISSTSNVQVRSSALQSSVAPERVAPDAGYIPDWEDRAGKSPEEFIESDMSKPDIAGMWECPLTRWDSDE